MPKTRFNHKIFFRRTLIACFLLSVPLFISDCNQSLPTESETSQAGADSIVYVVPDESTAVNIWPPLPFEGEEMMADTTGISLANASEPLTADVEGEPPVWELDDVSTTSGKSPVNESSNYELVNVSTISGKSPVNEPSISEPDNVSTTSGKSQVNVSSKVGIADVAVASAADTTVVGENPEAFSYTRADTTSASVPTMDVDTLDADTARLDTLVFHIVSADALISDTTRTDSLVADTARIDTLVFAVARVDTLILDSTEVVVVELRQPVVALRTNLLYDAALVPNIGLEIWLGKQFTIAADWFGTWLSWDERHLYWQGYGGYLTLRYYFGKQAAEHRFVGHHAGIYGSALTYDVEFGGQGYQAAKFGFGGGLEYGYSLRVNRSLSFDFTLGVGYQGGEYKAYQPTNDGTGHYEWLATYRRHWIGPTKAEVSLKWLIAPVDKKKGGAQ